VGRLAAGGGGHTGAQRRWGAGMPRPAARVFEPHDRRPGFAFDLWSGDDPSAHADAILTRLKAGTMPCDGGRPPERTAVFARWSSRQTILG
jgi:hypothetical protein